MKLYLAGPMTGLPNHNYTAFHLEAFRLRELGYEVVSPAEGHEIDAWPTDPELLWRYCMRRALTKLLQCDSIAFLPGWEKSRGCLVEFGMAKDLRMGLYLASGITEAEEEARKKEREMIHTYEFQLNLT